MTDRWRAIGLMAAALIAAAAPGDVRADRRERVNLIEENDSILFNSDKHYTQGLRLSYLGPDIGAVSAWNRPFEWFGAIAPVFPAAAQRSRRYAIGFGQSIFTPKDTDIRPPDPRDRPYAGWLYVDVSLLQETQRRRLDHLELQFGVVGPGSLARQTQNDFHQLIRSGQARGWDEQLQTEPGLVLSYERKWRLALIGDGRGGVDFIPSLGASLGNVFTYAAAGGMLRIGRNLGADYGPARIRPALSGSDYFTTDDFDGRFGYYFFIGAQGRAVGRDIFLDGNSFRTSRSVDKKTLVGDLQAGLSLFWSNGLALGLSVVFRSEEFEGQGSPDSFAAAHLSFSW